MVQKYPLMKLVACVLNLIFKSFHLAFSKQDLFAKKKARKWTPFSRCYHIREQLATHDEATVLYCTVVTAFAIVSIFLIMFNGMNCHVLNNNGNGKVLIMITFSSFPALALAIKLCDDK